MGDFNAKLEINNENMTQIMSRNGKILKKMLDDTDTIPVTMEDSVIKWTRSRKRLSSIEKSVIDYVIMTKEISQSIISVHIDEPGIYKLKGKEETDHNSIIIETKIPFRKKLTKEKRKNLKDPEGWKKFNKI